MQVQTKPPKSLFIKSIQLPAISVKQTRIAVLFDHLQILKVVY